MLHTDRIRDTIQRHRQTQTQVRLEKQKEQLANTLWQHGHSNSVDNGAAGVTDGNLKGMEVKVRGVPVVGGFLDHGNIRHDGHNYTAWVRSIVQMQNVTGSGALLPSCMVQ